MALWQRQQDTIPTISASAGVLGSIGKRNETPAYPLNLIGDFGGGALYLAMGLLAAMLEAVKSGKGQIVDAAMVDGAASMMTTFYGDARCRNMERTAWQQHS